MGNWLRGGELEKGEQGGDGFRFGGGGGLDVEGSGWVRGVLGCMRGGEHGLGLEGDGLES